jgi:hypothetical protein
MAVTYRKRTLEPPQSILLIRRTASQAQVGWQMMRRQGQFLNHTYGLTEIGCSDASRCQMQVPAGCCRAGPTTMVLAIADACQR